MPWRWWILILLFLATTINYLDRIVFSVLIPVIEKELGLSTQDYGYLTGAFQAAYTVGFLVAGKFIDAFGTRAGYATAIIWWSIAAALHVTARSAFALGVWRALLGFGESGNFPAAIKAVAEWFPRKDRAFATGIFNAGTNVASMIGPPLFVWLSAHYGWRNCFLWTASTGFVWVVAWLLMYRHPPAVVDPEESHSQERIGWTQALRYRATWAFALGKFLSDPVWWFYLFWLPKYLYEVRQFNMTEIGWALPVVYLMADFGSVGGGWLPGRLIRRGWPVARARQLAMLVCALAMPVAATSVFTALPWLAIALVSLATAAHQGWSANLFTTTSDAFPSGAVASVTGIGGCAGGIGGFLFSAILPGFVVSHFGYTPMFVLMGGMHLIAWLVLRALLWKPASSTR